MAEDLLALRKRLAAETTCPLCLDTFRQPVLTACGHSFCRQCLQAMLGQPPRPSACPQCRATLQPGSPHPNLSLGSVAELVRALEEVAGRPRCPRHDKPLALFCEPCAAPLCESCRDGPQHRRHRVRPAEEAFGEMRETLQSNLISLREKKEELKLRKKEENEKSQDLMVLATSELSGLTETFEQLPEFLKEQKNVLLAQLEQAIQEVAKKRDEYNSKVWERERLLDTVTARIEGKREQPAVEFLTDVGEILSSCEAAKAPIPEPFSPELQRSVESFFGMSQLVMDMTTKFKVNLWRFIGKIKRERMTVDPETANPYLKFASGYRIIWHKDEKQNFQLDVSKRFLNSPSVLGSKGFTSGGHYWDVNVWNGHSWAVGVALESVPRNKSLNLAKEIWALQRDEDGQYRAVHTISAPLAVREKLQEIRVYLNYRAGQVTFYNAKNMAPILQFKAIFTGKVFPYFCLYSQRGSLVVY